MSDVVVEADGLLGAEPQPLPRYLAAAWTVAIAGLLCLFGAVALFGNPHAGDPELVLDLSPQAVAPVHHAAVVHKIAAAKQFTPPVAPPAQPAVPPEISTPIYAGSALVADPVLIEQTRDGPLPRIAQDGRSPMTAYAPPVAALAKKPRIAIVIGGLGISAKMTQAAIAGLPPAVTLAFAPYAGDVQRWVNEARAKGHEVLLEVPMEPYDFPDSDPGPHTLRAGAAEDGNIDRLEWAMTRFTGYAGVTNLLGSRFLSDGQALEPVMAFVQRRGLMFFDNASAAHSAASAVAHHLDAPYLQSTATLDAIQTPAEIDARLSQLESRARSDGASAGTGFLYPLTVDRVAAWAKGLSGRGFVLVPASAIVPKSK